ncbi:methionine aminopeptidase [Bacillus sp. Marseille-P3661]|uniref:methionine aminopeptidase n=1 Tax=Bacillus sp. Marseille-P3661 TaxID=1936234 RepID=UPI000C835351|nr:methionine aminopeptidase [Bacillus sp. Marseille-P3661]
MGLLNSFMEWNSARYEKKIAKMEAKGICPDCYGRGINSAAFNEFVFTNSYECPGCNGSGHFSDWAGINEFNQE